MKKVMVLAAMLAMMMAMAAPAFAQTAVDDSVSVDNSTTVEYNAVCQNVIGSITTGDAAQYGDATAAAAVDSAAAAEVAAELDTSVEVVNECLNAEGIVVDYSSYSHGGGGGGGYHAAVLPDTGGASLITLATGALLVAGGLIARRIVR